MSPSRSATKGATSSAEEKKPAPERAPTSSKTASCLSPASALESCARITSRTAWVPCAANHERIVEALPHLSGAELNALMRESLAGWKNEVLDELLPADPN